MAYSIRERDASKSTQTYVFIFLDLSLGNPQTPFGALPQSPIKAKEI